MSTQSHPVPRRRTRSPGRRAAARRRALLRRVVVAVVALAAIAGLARTPLFHHAVREIGLPLRHEDIIRQQARAKGIDPALIAAVIFAESHFRDGQHSAAGAQGLMQITPATAEDIARRSGGTQFVVDDVSQKRMKSAIVSSVTPSLRSSRSSTRTMRSSRLAIAASRRSESSGERNDPIAASATSDLGLP